MAPSMVLNPTKLLTEDNGYCIPKILTELSNMYRRNELDPDFTTIGIAKNVMLGVFKLMKTSYGYDCYRVCFVKDKLYISDVGYPVTNIGNPKYAISCEIDFILATKLLVLI